MMDNHSDTHGDDHDHHDDHLVFSEFHLWTSIPSTILLLIEILMGSFANTFICYCLYKKKIGVTYLNPVLLLISLKNLLAIMLCIPLAIIMLLWPSVIQRVTCSVQEDVTYTVVFAGYLFPTLLSVIQCDQIIRHQRSFFNLTRVKIILTVVCVIATILGMQAQIQNDDHGCHLWSIRTDDVVLTYIYSVAITVCIALVVMTTSYALIYHHACAVNKKIQGNKELSAQDGTSNERRNQTQNPKGVSSYVPYRRKMTTAILKPMFCIVANNLLTSLPWVILYTATAFHGIESSAKYAEMRVLTMAIMYIPIAAEPVIFLAFSTKGRAALKNLWNHVKSKNGTVVPSVTGTEVLQESGSRVI